MFRFPAAPWPTVLKVISVLSTVALLGASYALVKAIPLGTRAPFAQEFGSIIAVVPAIILAVAALFVVTGYEVDPTELRIQRLLWSTRVSLDGLTRAWADPSAMRGSIRVFGNGGLYSFSGVFYHVALGRYRAFVTDSRRAVVLKMNKRVVVVSPAEPAQLVQALSTLVPGLKTEPPG